MPGVSYGTAGAGRVAAAKCESHFDGNGDSADHHHNHALTETTSLLPNGNTITFQNEETASWVSHLFFSWMAPLMRLGNAKKKLDPEDVSLIPLPYDSRSDYVSRAFDKAWQEELDRVKAKAGSRSKSKGKSSSGEPSLIRALFRAFGTDYAVGGFLLKLIHDSCIFVGPQVLNRMILFLGDDTAPVSRGLWLTAAVTLSQLIMSFCLRHYFFKCYKFGLRIRTAVVVAVYQKALVLCAGERHGRSLGEITNLMSIDAQRLQELTTYLHAIWYSFFQISLALFFLWRQL